MPVPIRCAKRDCLKVVTPSRLRNWKNVKRYCSRFCQQIEHNTLRHERRGDGTNTGTGNMRYKTERVLYIKTMEVLGHEYTDT